MQTDVGQRIMSLIDREGLVRGGNRDSSKHLHLDWHPSAPEQLEALVVDFLTETENLAKLHGRDSRYE